MSIRKRLLWGGSTVSLSVLALFMAGCDTPKQPERLTARITEPQASGETLLTTNWTVKFQGSALAEDGRIVEANCAWDWGDGKAGEEGCSTTHTFPSEGTYTVTLTVWPKNQQKPTAPQGPHVTQLRIAIAPPEGPSATRMKALGIFVLHGVARKDVSFQDALRIAERLEVYGPEANEGATRLGQTAYGFGADLARQPGPDVVPNDIALQLARGAVERMSDSQLMKIVSLARALSLDIYGESGTSVDFFVLRGQIVDCLVAKAREIVAIVKSFEAQLRKRK